MANYKKYQVIGASKYEVTHDGKVFNIKKNKEISIQSDGRVKIIGDDGKQKRITPHVEYNKAKYEDDKNTHVIKTIKVKNTEGENGGTNEEVKEERVVVGEYDLQNYFELGQTFPNYYIERKANVFHKNNINVHVKTYYNDTRVYIYNDKGRLCNLNRFKLYCIYVLGQKNVGPVHVEDFYFMFKDNSTTNALATRNDVFVTKQRIRGIYDVDVNGYGSNVVGTYCGDDKLSERRVSIIPNHLRFAKIRFLEFYPFYMFVYIDRNNYYVAHKTSGHRVKEHGVGTDKRFVLPVLKSEYDHVEGEWISGAEFKEVPMNKLHKDPKFESFKTVVKPKSF